VGAAAAMREAVWEGCRTERAQRWEYDPSRRDKWRADPDVITVVVHNKDFGEGGLRTVRRLREVDRDGGYIEYVAKWFKFEAEKREWYFAEAEAQMVAEELAQKFNKLPQGPPKKVGFVPVHVIELVDRAERPLYNVEPLLKGAYEKHNDNDGGIFTQGQNSRDPKMQFVRNTPQAFSHFTFANSGGKMVVCDIQGVHDMYTDPQIHTLDGKGFGQGNMGKGGIDKWIKTHVCNDICRYLGLCPVAGGPSAGGAQSWSKPETEYAQYIGIDPRREPELMWIAQEGLEAPLPAGWAEASTADGVTYYYETATRRSLWEHPYDQHYRDTVKKTRAAQGSATKAQVGPGAAGGGRAGGARRPVAGRRLEL